MKGEYLMTDAELIIALFRPVRITEEPPDEIGQCNEEQRRNQRELLDDLIAEQCERM